MKRLLIALFFAAPLAATPTVRRPTPPLPAPNFEVDDAWTREAKAQAKYNQIMHSPVKKAKPPVSASTRPQHA